MFGCIFGNTWTVTRASQCPFCFTHRLHVSLRTCETDVVIPFTGATYYDRFLSRYYSSTTRNMYLLINSDVSDAPDNFENLKK